MTCILRATLLAMTVAAISLSTANARHTSERLDCEAKYEYALENLCTYAGERWPCFVGSKLHGEQITHPFTTRQLTGHCCDVHCSLEELYKFYCCHTPDCLRQCYGHRRSYETAFQLLKK